MKKRKKITNALDEEAEKFLKRVGYTQLKLKHGKIKSVNKFPDLSINDHRKKYPSVGGFAKPTGKKELPVGAKQFPVGHSHKSGLQLITDFDDLKYMSGKKF